MASRQLPGDTKTMDISLEKCAHGFTAASWRIQTINHGFTTASLRFQNHWYFIATMCKWLHNSFLEISYHESAASSGARACGTRDKSSKPASDISEPTCKAATGAEVSRAKLKIKPAASIEQSSNRFQSIPINSQPQAGKPPTQLASKYHICLSKC